MYLMQLSKNKIDYMATKTKVKCMPTTVTALAM